MSLLLAGAMAASLYAPIACPMTRFDACTVEQVESAMHATPKGVAQKDSECLYETDADCTVMASGTLSAGNGARVAWQKVELSGPFPRTEMVMLFDIDQQAVSFIGQGQSDGYYGSPEFYDGPDGQLLLHVPGVMAGTGSGNADMLFAYDERGNWRWIDIESWKENIADFLPEGFGIWQGVDYRFGSMFAFTPVWRDSDGNCCATGGKAYLDFTIEDDMLVLTDLSFMETVPADKVPQTPSLGFASLTCPVEQAVYENPEQPIWQISFTKPEYAPSIASDLLMMVTGASFVRDFAFTASQGFGGTYLLVAEDDEEAGQPMPIEDKPENLAFYAFVPGVEGGLIRTENPPQSGEPAPSAIFIPDVSRYFWYDEKYVDIETGEVLPDPVDMDQGLFIGKCASD